MCYVLRASADDAVSVVSCGQVLVGGMACVAAVNVCECLCVWASAGGWGCFLKRMKVV